MSYAPSRATSRIPDVVLGAVDANLIVVEKWPIHMDTCPLIAAITNRVDHQ